MKMKMWIGNLDGRRTGLVITTSKARAAKIAGTSRTDFEAHWTQQPGINDLEVEQLYTRKMQHTGSTAPSPWQRGRCPL